MVDELPKKIVDIDQIRINRGLNKICSCKNRKFVIDTTNRLVKCSSCGATLDPYDALYDLAHNGSKLRKQVENLLEQQKQIAEYKPWLRVIKRLEKSYRGKKMIPCCPRCKEPFYLEEIDYWMGRPYADARIHKYKRLHNEKG